MNREKPKRPESQNNWKFGIIGKTGNTKKQERIGKARRTGTFVLHYIDGTNHPVLVGKAD